MGLSQTPRQGWAPKAPRPPGRHRYYLATTYYTRQQHHPDSTELLILQGELEIKTFFSVKSNISKYFRNKNLKDSQQLMSVSRAQVVGPRDLPVQ